MDLLLRIVILILRGVIILLGVVFLLLGIATFDLAHPANAEVGVGLIVTGAVMISAAIFVGRKH